MPRRYVAARKPAASPSAPPPMATIGSSRSTRSRASSLAAASTTDRRLAASPSGSIDGRDRPTGRGEPRGEALAGRRPRPGLGHEDRPPRLEATQGLLDGRSRDAVAQESRPIGVVAAA